MINLRLDKPYHGEYIMSIREDKLYFQKINRFFGMLRPDSDFEITITEYSYFKIEIKKARASLILYKDNGDYISIDYMIGTKESFSTEDNIERITKCFLELKLHRMEVKDGE
jgi:hypothetical protein